MIFNHSYNRKKALCLDIVYISCLVLLIIRVIYLMTVRADYYAQGAKELQERERTVLANRGSMYDRNGEEIASSESVCTVFVVHNQIEDIEYVITYLSDKLSMDPQIVREKVERVNALEKIKSNVSMEIAAQMLLDNVPGVKIDQTSKRYYPYGNMASKVLGFTGGDNQGILGLEAVYDSYLKGTDGIIYTTTDGKGREVEGVLEQRQEPISGNDLHLTLDAVIQSWCQTSAQKAYENCQADGVSILAMNPQNGEVLAMVDYPEYDLNDPFTLIEPYTSLENVSQTDAQNMMWRNACINDTYEPGSVFKIITTAIALEEDLVTREDAFYCPGYIIVEDRRIRCHKTVGHGAETFEDGIKNSCNPVFIDLGLRIGSKNFYMYFEKFGLLDKTGIDLPGESSTIMHNPDKIGQVELATVAFGQSFQVSPIRLLTTISELINGGHVITPHLVSTITDTNGNVVWEYKESEAETICSEETTEELQYLLEQVVSDGTGSNAYIEGYEIGGKTATSQTLPRSEHKYIASFMGFAPADDPKVIVLVIIRNPQGAYYGGTIAAPVAKEIFSNLIPYLLEK